MKKTYVAIIVTVVMIALIGVAACFSEIEYGESDDYTDRTEARKISNNTIADRKNRATTKRRSNTICVFGISLVLPVKVVESDSDESETVKWKSYISDSEGSYILIQYYNAILNPKKMIKEFIDADGNVSIMKSNIVKLDFDENKTGYEADYSMDSEYQHILIFNSEDGTIAVIHNSPCLFGDIATKIAWQAK